MFPAEPLPEKIGAYTILERLPSLGSHEVFLGRSEGALGFQREVALKLMPDTSEGNTRFAEEMAREAAICSRLSHPAIVRVLDFFEHQKKLVLVLEHAEGTTLEQLLHHLAEKHQKLGDAASLYIAQQIAGALSYAHSAVGANDEPTPIIHRNLHPENILISAEGEVRLTGFGVGKIIGRTPDTAIGKVKGTPGFMAPEQARGEPVTAKADVYGVGVLLWSLLANTSPPTDGSWPRKIKTLRSDLPKEVVAIIDAALDPFPGTRKITSREIDQWLSKIASPTKGQAELKERVAELVTERKERESDAGPISRGRSTDPGLGASKPNPFQGVRFGAPGAPKSRASTAGFKAVTPEQIAAAALEMTPAEPRVSRTSMRPTPAPSPAEPIRRSSQTALKAVSPEAQRRPSQTALKAVSAEPPPAQRAPVITSKSAVMPAQTSELAPTVIVSDPASIAVVRPAGDTKAPITGPGLEAAGPTVEPAASDASSDSSPMSERPKARVKPRVRNTIPFGDQLAPAPGMAAAPAASSASSATPTAATAPPAATSAPPPVAPIFDPATLKPERQTLPGPHSPGDTVESRRGEAIPEPVPSLGTPARLALSSPGPFSTPTPPVASVRFGPPPPMPPGAQTPRPPIAGEDSEGGHIGPPRAPPSVSRRPPSTVGTVVLSALTASIVVALALYLLWSPSRSGTQPAASGSASSGPLATSSATSAPAAASAAPSASAPASASAAPGEPNVSELPYGFGYLTVTSPAQANVYIFGKLLGPVNQALRTRCGKFFMRLAAPNDGGPFPEWVSAGQTIEVPCQQAIKVEAKN